jgi:hypothetical protein
MFATREAVIESTSGRPALARPVALKDEDGLVHPLMARGVRLIQVIEERLDLGGQQDLPLPGILLSSGRYVTAPP